MNYNRIEHLLSELFITIFIIVITPITVLVWVSNQIIRFNRYVWLQFKEIHQMDKE